MKGIHIHVHIHHHGDADESEISEQLNLIIQNQQTMGQELAKLTQEVTETKTIMLSAKTLIEGISEKLRANAEDKAAILALADELDTSANDLATAVAANTPAESGTGETTP